MWGMSYVDPKQPWTLDTIKPGTRVWVPVCNTTLLGQEPLQRLESGCAWTSREEALTHFWFERLGKDMPEVWLEDMMVEKFLRGELPKKPGLFSELFRAGHILEWLHGYGLTSSAGSSYAQEDPG